MGAPNADDVNPSLLSEETKALEEAAEAAGITPGEYIRRHGFFHSFGSSGELAMSVKESMEGKTAIDAEHSSAPPEDELDPTPSSIRTFFVLVEAGLVHIDDPDGSGAYWTIELKDVFRALTRSPDFS